MSLVRSLVRRTKALSAFLSPVSSRGGGWWPVVREPWTGAWQRNAESTTEDVLTNPFVYACFRLIATDIGKLNLHLVEEDANGIWQKTTRPSPFLPVIRRPNHYSTRNEFFEQWMYSKLIHGNTYVLKQRDQRGVVAALYVLDPSRVTVLVAPNGDVYYQLGQDDLSRQHGEITVPMTEIIHDKMTALYHPLVGLSPLTAAGRAASQGLRIQENATQFFGNGSNPGGILTIEQPISNETAVKLRDQWQANYGGQNYGQVAVLGAGMKFQAVTVQARDAQLNEQWNSTAQSICTAIGVPAFKIGVGQMPAYNNVEPLNQAYYSDCLQTHIEKIEALLDYGLELPKPYGTEFDLDDLIRMDGAAKVTAAAQAVRAGMAVNEARYKYYDLGPVKGGETPFAQLQDWPIHILAERGLADLMADPTVRSSVPVSRNTMDDMADDMADDEAEKMLADLTRKSLEWVAA
jgi:HK97 family phage portal protein